MPHGSSASGEGRSGCASDGCRRFALADGCCLLHSESEKSCNLFRVEVERILRTTPAGTGIDFRSCVFPRDWGNWRELLGNGEFHVPVTFSNAHFKGREDFSKVVFHRGVDFSTAVFEEPALFSAATFKVQALFDATRFMQGGVMHLCRFHCTPSFRAAHVQGEDLLFFGLGENRVFFQGADLRALDVGAKARIRLDGVDIGRTLLSGSTPGTLLIENALWAQSRKLLVGTRRCLYDEQALADALCPWHRLRAAFGRLVRRLRQRMKAGARIHSVRGTPISSKGGNEPPPQGSDRRSRLEWSATSVAEAWRDLHAVEKMYLALASQAQTVGDHTMASDFLFGAHETLRIGDCLRRKPLRKRRALERGDQLPWWRRRIGTYWSVLRRRMVRDQDRVVANCLASWWRRWVWSTSAWYRNLGAYGESPAYTLLVLITLWLLLGIGMHVAGTATGHANGVCAALLQSAEALLLRQPTQLLGDEKAHEVIRILFLIGNILGPVQITLLVVSLRRRLRRGEHDFD